MPAKCYTVPLTAEEREVLLTLIAPGKTAAKKLTRARILLQADQGLQGPAWSDQHMSQALHVSHLTVERTPRTFVDAGLEAALTRKQRARPGNQKCAGAKDAHLIALACAQPPAGYTHWPLTLLADKMVECHQLEAISPETIRRHLKKVQ